jgi:hypothetical protein
MERDDQHGLPYGGGVVHTTLLPPPGNANAFTPLASILQLVGVKMPNNAGVMPADLIEDEDLLKVSASHIELSSPFADIAFFHLYGFLRSDMEVIKTMVKREQIPEEARLRRAAGIIRVLLADRGSKPIFWLELIQAVYFLLPHTPVLPPGSPISKAPLFHSQ